MTERRAPRDGSEPFVPPEVPGDGQYVVTAPLAVVRLRSTYQHLYRGAPVPLGVSAVQLEMLLKAGMITRSNGG